MPLLVATIIAVMVFNDGIYPVIDELIVIADRVFYPLIIGISVVAYSYTNGIN